MTFRAPQAQVYRDVRLELRYDKEKETVDVTVSPRG
jgi:hypothetical protein